MRGYGREVAAAGRALERRACSLVHSCQQTGKIGFSLSHGAGQRDASQVESKQTGYVVAFGAGHLLLRLNYFHRGGYSGIKSIPGLAQRFVRETAIVLGEPNLADGGLQFDQGGTNLLLDAAALIG